MTKVQVLILDWEVVDPKRVNEVFADLRREIAEVLQLPEEEIKVTFGDLDVIWFDVATDDEPW